MPLEPVQPGPPAKPPSVQSGPPAKSTPVKSGPPVKTPPTQDLRTGRWISHHTSLPPERDRVRLTRGTSRPPPKPKAKHSPIPRPVQGHPVPIASQPRMETASQPAMASTDVRKLLEDPPARPPGDFSSQPSSSGSRVCPHTSWWYEQEEPCEEQESCCVL